MNSTLRDVATLAEVGISTVSRVINGNYPVSEETKLKVMKAIEILNYRPNGIARSLKSQKTWVIGAIVADISNPFYMQLIKGVENIVSLENYSIIIASTDENQEKEKKIINLLLDRQVDGLVIASCQWNNEFFKNLTSINTPIVMADRYIKDVDYDLVIENNESASYELTSHLIKMGHNKICVVCGSNNISTSYTRYLGYENALKKFNLPIIEEYIINGSINSIYENASRFFDKIPKDKLPTAIYATNNTRAEIIIKILHERGIKIPEDISLVSYGDITNSFMYPIKLTHVVQDILQIGKKTGEILLDKLSNNNSSRIKEYIINASICYGDSVKKLI